MGRTSKIPVKMKLAAIESILSGERKQADVAREYGLSRQAVSQWVKTHREGKRLGRRKQPEVTEAQKDELFEAFTSRRPADFQISTSDPDGAWDLFSGRELLLQVTGHPYRENFVANLMDELGWEPDLPVEFRWYYKERPGPKQKHRSSDQRVSKKTREVKPKARNKDRREMSLEDLEKMKDSIRQTQSGIPTSPLPRLHGVRTGKNAKGNIQQKKKSKKRQKKKKRKARKRK